MDGEVVGWMMGGWMDGEVGALTMDGWGWRGRMDGQMERLVDECVDIGKGKEVVVGRWVAWWLRG